jgi:phage tail-like protein
MPQPTEPSQSQPGVRKDRPYRQYNFKLVITGVVEGYFTRMEGLRVEVPPLYFRPAGQNSSVQALPGPVHLAPVTFWYGVSDSMELMRWLFTSVSGRVERRNVSVAMLDNAGSAEVRRFNLLQAWPCDWSGALLNSMGKDLAIESLTLAYDELKLDDAPATTVA